MYGTTLDKAKDIINGDRRATYGDVEASFKRIALLWSARMNIEFTPRDVADLMILLKVSRNVGGKGSADNYVDICGYAALANEAL